MERNPAITDITAARDASLADISAATTVGEIVALTTRYAGKKSELSVLKKQPGGLDSIDEKKAAGAAVNDAMAAVDVAVDEQRSALSSAARA